MNSKKQDLIHISVPLIANKKVLSPSDFRLYTDEIPESKGKICEFEQYKAKWQLLEDKHEKSIFQLVNSLIPSFRIDKIVFFDTKFRLFKLSLTAQKQGESSFLLKTKVKAKEECIQSFIQQEGLINNRREPFELRIGDKVVIYFQDVI